MNFNRSYYLFFVISYAVGFTIYSLIVGEFLRIIWGLGPVLLVIVVFSKSKSYRKIYFMVLSSLVIFSALILTYVYVFMPALILQPKNYFAIVMFFVYLILLIYGYINRENITANNK